MVTRSAIALIGGRLLKRRGHWQSSDFSSCAWCRGAPGGRWRVLAAHQLYRSAKDGNQIIVSSGKAKRSNPKRMPAIAPVIKKELIALGVPARAIILETKSTNTWQNLRNLLLISRAQRLKQITVVSNRYHLPRIRAMVQSAPGLNGLAGSVQVKYRSAESVLVKNRPRRWRALVRRVYTSPLMAQLRQRERSGIRDIKAGRYHFQ